MDRVRGYIPKQKQAVTNYYHPSFPRILPLTSGCRGERRRRQAIFEHRALKTQL